MKNLFPLFILFVLVLASCKKTNTSTPTTSRDYSIIEVNFINKNKRGSFGTGLMGCFFLPSSNGAGFQNSICDINQINGNETGILSLQDATLNYCPISNDYKIVGLSYMCPATIKFKSTKSGIYSLDVDLVGIVEFTDHRNSLIYINSTSGMFAWGESIGSGFHHCEFDFDNLLLTSFNWISNEYMYKPLFNSSIMFTPSNSNTWSNYIDGSKKGIFINKKNIESQNGDLGYIYSDASTVSNPLSNYVYHYYGEITQLDNIFYTSPVEVGFGANAYCIQPNDPQEAYDVANFRTCTEITDGNALNSLNKSYTSFNHKHDDYYQPAILICDNPYSGYPSNSPNVFYVDYLLSDLTDKF